MPLIVVEVAQRFCQRLHVRFAIAATDLWPNPFGPGAYTPIVTKHAAAASSLLCFTIINDPSFRLADWHQQTRLLPCWSILFADEAIACSANGNQMSGVRRIDFDHLSESHYEVVN